MNYMYLDIETAGDEKISPDLMESIKAGIKPDKRAKDPEASKMDKYIELLEEASLNPLMNRVIAIGYGITSDTDQHTGLVKLEVLMYEDERTILEHFYKVIEEFQPARIFTFNGQSFDLPVLRVAYARHDMHCPIRQTSKYDPSFHTDVRAVLTNYDQYARGTQEQWAMRLGISVGERTYNGSDIPGLWKSRNVTAIKGKCYDDIKILISLSGKVAKAL